MNIFAFVDRWWEAQTARNPQLALSDKTFDQSHTHHALICAIAGALTWLALGWWLGPRAWAHGVLAAIAMYLVREAVWRIGSVRFNRRLYLRVNHEPMRWWDGLLDIGKPLWAPGALALAVVFGNTPTWVVALDAILTFAIAYAYTFGRPAGALFYDGQY